MKQADEQELERWRALLRINRHQLDDALEVQAEHQERISDKVAEMDARVVDAKDNLAKTEAGLTEDFRESAKSTKDVVEAKVRRHPERIKAWERYQEAARQLAQWQGLLDAWKARGKDLHALGRLFGDQYFTLTSITGSSRFDSSRPAVTRKDYSAVATGKRTRSPAD